MQIAKWLLYLFLSGTSIIITWNVIEQFKSKATGFFQRVEPIIENPTITFCFEENDLHLEFGKNFDITMGNKLGIRLKMIV